jgi:thermitase
MLRKWASIAIIALLGLLLIPKGHHPGDLDRPEKMSAEREIELKQQTVSADVKLTDELCRSQCSLALHKTVEKINGAPADDQAVMLKKLQQDHPHMSQLNLYTAINKQTRVQSVGNLKPSVATGVKQQMEKAKTASIKGMEYHSSPLIIGGETYFVLGVPSNDKNTALVGVVHQQILGQVAAHQIKNLRIIPYPSSNHWKIESVDSNTLQNVKVNHPEDNEGTSHYHKNEVVVKFKQPPTDAQLQQIKNDIKAIRMQKLGYTYVFRADNMDAKQLMNYFQAWHVDYAEPHFLYMTNENTSNEVPAPNDLLYSKYQWNLPITETVVGWGVNKGSDKVIVGIVDTGVDVNHPDLQGRLLPGYNVVNPDAQPIDDVGHGTHVAGVISALVNNDEGIAGMTWYNPILPVKVLDETGAGNTYNVAQGIIWATDHGAKVINMSLGNYADANFLHDAIKYAYDKDVVLLAAAGNDNSENLSYPAAYPEVLAVAAVDANKKKAAFSNFGDYIGVTAPGVNIASTYPHNQYAALSGTSMASPHVTALAALIRSTNPALKNTEVMDIMRKSAEDLGAAGKDKYFGYGQIDVVKALQMAQGNTAVGSDATPSNVAPLAGLGQWLSREIDQIRNQLK